METTTVETKMTFKDLNINKEILKALDEMGFENPSEIQEKAIPALLETGRDFIGQAQTGTGKTAAFVIPILQKINFSSRDVQAIILAPTRELAVQVESEIQKIGKFMNVVSACIYGGVSYEKQIKALRNDQPHIVVGTPGRVLDMINKKMLKLHATSFCVLDEADEMLKMGFFDDVVLILERLSSKRQLVMFSATMPKPILELIKTNFSEPEIVRVEKKMISNENIEQQFVVVKERYFCEALSRIISVEDEVYAMVFCKTKVETKRVGAELTAAGLTTEVLNGDMGQNERDLVMRNFKERKMNILVCTDVAARGIDVNNLTHVFNFGLPQSDECYVHRIGRTGRAGMKGKAYTIIAPSQVGGIKRMMRNLRLEIAEAKVPSAELIKEKMVEKELLSLNTLVSAMAEKGDEFKVDQVFEKFSNQFNDLSKEQVLKLMFTWKFNKTIRQLNNLPSLGEQRTSPVGNVAGGRGREDRRRRGSRSDDRRGGEGRRSGGRRFNDNRGEDRHSDERRGKGRRFEDRLGKGRRSDERRGEGRRRDFIGNRSLGGEGRRDSSASAQQ
ncbi:MAG: DEAD/DEAH box helicase [Bdellovibrio sp.]